eukprot:15139-Heterococcus_DN1.PRE.5
MRTSASGALWRQDVALDQVCCDSAALNQTWRRMQELRANGCATTNSVDPLAHARAAQQVVQRRSWCNF